MEDHQAVGRVYRIGQKQRVKVYRLLMSGMIDEKVYGKQVQKDAMIREVLTRMILVLPIVRECLT